MNMEMLKLKTNRYTTQQDKNIIFPNHLIGRGDGGLKIKISDKYVFIVRVVAMSSIYFPGGEGCEGEVTAVVNYSQDTDRDGVEVAWKNGHFPCVSPRVPGGSGPKGHQECQPWVLL